MKKRPSICFVAHNAFGVLVGEDRGHIGGIERQQSMMARALVRRGYSVSIITWDNGQPDDYLVAGVRVFKMCGQDAGVKPLRFIYPRWTSLYRAMDRANADIYYYNCGDLGLGQIVIWALWNRKKTLFSVACEEDCKPGLPVLKQLRERILYRYGLLRCDHIVVQTSTQKKLLKDGFGLKSTVLPMPSLGFNHLYKKKSPGSPARVVWAGRFTREKRLEWLLDIAAFCPDITFDILGAANVLTPYDESIVMRANSMENVLLHGRVLHKDVGAYLKTADLLCCTSVYEGFPNTFLEAWSLGIPVVSSFDPGEVISLHGLGSVGENPVELAEKIRRLVSSEDRWREASDAAIAYFLKNHTLESSMSGFEEIFKKLTAEQALERA